MTHPESCQDPYCKLPYAQHLNFYVSAAAQPTRRPHEAQAIITEERWKHDHAAFETLHKQGYDVPQLDGAACRADEAKTDADIEYGHVKVDWSRPR